MAGEDVTSYLKYLCLYAVFSSVSSLTLPYMVTSKPKHIKQMGAQASEGKTQVNPTSQSVTSKPSGVSVYRVTDSKGSTCILLQTDGLIEVIFKTPNIGEEKVDSYMPDSPLVEGNCRDEDNQYMRVMWEGYSLVFYFAKTPGGERWYIQRIELTVKTDMNPNHNLKINGKNNIRLAHTTMLFPTPVGNSYSCEESKITLEPYPEDNLPAGLKGTIFLREFQLQPFMYKGNNFGPAFKCNAQLGFRDETAPIAVGSTLAIAVLGTITGYAAWRYFKVKKVQYNTME